MSILSVDLASNRYKDIGVAALGIRDESVAIEFVEANACGLQASKQQSLYNSQAKDLYKKAEAFVKSLKAGSNRDSVL
jgi:hypothetical protein